MMVVRAGVALRVVVEECGAMGAGAIAGGATIANFISCQEIKNENNKTARNVDIRQMNARGERVD